MNARRTWRVWTNASPAGPSGGHFYAIASGLSVGQATDLVGILLAAGWDANLECEEDDDE